MYAIIQDSGQQFRVAEGDILDVDLRDLDSDASTIEFNQVLLTSDDGDIKVGTPLVKGATVTGTIMDPKFKGPKVHSYYLRRRKSSQKKIGHRQKYIRVRIEGITV